MTTNNKNGGLFTYTHFNNKIVGLVSLSCETDFAERTNDFKILGSDLAMQVASSDVESVADFLKEECIVDNGTVEDRIKTLAKQLKEKVEVLRIEKIKF